MAATSLAIMDCDEFHQEISQDRSLLYSCATLLEPSLGLAIAASASEQGCHVFSVPSCRKGLSSTPAWLISSSCCMSSTSTLLGTFWVALGIPPSALVPNSTSSPIFKYIDHNLVLPSQALSRLCSNSQFCYLSLPDAAGITAVCHHD